MRSVKKYNDSKEQTEIGSNFWISFTDIMSCLLLIFLFLLTIILVNTNSDSDNPEELKAKINRLNTEVRNLNVKINNLQNENDKLKKNNSELEWYKVAYWRVKNKYDSLIAENGEFHAYNEDERKLIDSIESLTKEINSNLNHKKVEFDVSSKTIHIPESLIRFEKGKAELPQDSESREFTKMLSQKLYQHLSSLQKQSLIDSVFIEGHTDSDLVRNDPEKGNWKLSSERAINFWLALDNYNALSTLQNPDGAKLFSVSGYADSRPHECSKEGSRYNIKGACARNDLTKLESDSLKRRIDIRFNTYHKNHKKDGFVYDAKR